MREIKPCPSCGGEAGITWDNGRESKGSQYIVTEDWEQC